MLVIKDNNGQSVIELCIELRKEVKQFPSEYEFWNLILLVLCWIIYQANFTRAVASLSKAQAKKVARFLPNPERYWGPKVRAGRQITSKHVSLMGEEAIKGSANHEEGEESDAKRQKMDNNTSDSWS